MEKYATESRAFTLASQELLAHMVMQNIALNLYFTYHLMAEMDLKSNCYCTIGVILGDVVMKGFSVTFDRMNSMLGFATSKCAGKLIQIQITDVMNNFLP